MIIDLVKFANEPYEALLGSLLLAFIRDEVPYLVLNFGGGLVRQLEEVAHDFEDVHHSFVVQWLLAFVREKLGDFSFHLLVEDQVGFLVDLRRFGSFGGHIILGVLVLCGALYNASFGTLVVFGAYLLRG
jgi:hypothetical protein